MVAAKARHFQRIGNAAAGFLGQVLQVGVDVVVRHQHRLLFLEQALDALFQRDAFFGGGRGWRARPGVGGAAGAVLWMLVLDGFDLYGLHGVR